MILTPTQHKEDYNIDKLLLFSNSFQASSVMNVITQRFVYDF